MIQLTFSLVVPLLFVPPQVGPGSWYLTEDAKVQPPGPPAGARFGEAVALSGHRMVVGATGDSVGGAFAAGTVRVLEPDPLDPDGWEVVAELHAPNPAPFSWFGSYVAIDGETIVAGQLLSSSGGGVFVYERDPSSGNWDYVTELVSGTPGGGDRVAVYGDRAVVGAFTSPTGGFSNAGAVHVYERDQGGPAAWGLVATLTPETPLTNGRFGLFVSVWGDTIAVLDLSPGQVHVYERDPVSAAWERTDVLSTPEGELWVPALEGDVLAVGGPTLAASGVSFSGSLFVYERDPMGSGEWLESAVLTPSDIEDGDLFGYQLDIDASRIVVGARGKANLGYSAGAAYVFVRDPAGPTAWREVARLTSSAPGPSDYLGTSVAIAGERIAAGAPGTDEGGDAGTIVALAHDPLSGRLFGCDRELDRLVWIDPATGAGERIGGLDFTLVESLACDPQTGQLYGVDNATDQLLSIDPDTGAGTAIGPTGFPVVTGLTFDAAGGRLYGAKRGSSGVYALITLDTSTGKGTSVGPIGFSSVSCLAFDPVGGMLYAAADAGGSLALIAIDPNTGAGSLVGGLAWDDLPGLTFDGAGRLLGAEAQGGQLVSIDTASAAGTSIGPFSTPPLDDAGAVHTYELPFEAQGYCTSGVSASGCQAHIAALGLASATSPGGFQLTAGDVEGEKDGLFFLGTSGRQANPWGNGSSLQCVAPPVKRTPLLSGSGTAGACDGALSLDLNALWCPSCPRPEKNPGSGAMVQTQLWYRDPLSTSNQSTSLSDALEFTVFP